MSGLMPEYNSSMREKSLTFPYKTLSRSEERTMDDYIQIGVISARAPDGTFLPAQPIFTRRTPEAEAAEEAALEPVAKIFATKFAQYLRETRKIGAQAP